MSYINIPIKIAIWSNLSACVDALAEITHIIRKYTLCTQQAFCVQNRKRAACVDASIPFAQKILFAIAPIAKVCADM